MEDIPNSVLYIILFILIVVVILFVLKYKFNWSFKISIGRKDEEVIKSDDSVKSNDNNTNDNSNNTNDNNDKAINEKDKQEIIDEVVKNVENKIENFRSITEEETESKSEVIDKEDNKSVNDVNNSNQISSDSLDKLIESKINQKINEKINDYITRNNDELIVKRKYNNYNVMLNEPVGRLKQSKLMIDQLIDKNLERYYAYVKPIAIEDKQKEAYNANTFCLKCDSRDSDYSNYFFNDPLEYQNDKLDNNDNKGITAYNI
mgnify:CR=1 FL=1